MNYVIKNALAPTYSYIISGFAATSKNKHKIGRLHRRTHPKWLRNLWRVPKAKTYFSFTVIMFIFDVSKKEKHL